MARHQDICEVPGCTNEITNMKRGMCGACVGADYYWSRKKKGGRAAIAKRQKQLEFWNQRLDWLFQPGRNR